MHNNPSKLLDGILKILADDFNSSKTINELTLKFFERELKKEEQFNLSVVIPQYETITLNALLFLLNEGFVSTKDNNSFLITTKGFIKLKTESFSKEIKNKTVNLLLQRATWFCSITALFISVYNAFLKSENYSNTVSNCNCKNVTALTHSESNKKFLIEKDTAQKIKQLHKIK